MVEAWNTWIWPTVWIVIKILVIVVPVLLSVAYLTLAERKVIGAMQLRKGPNIVGPFGLFQPLGRPDMHDFALEIQNQLQRALTQI